MDYEMISYGLNGLLIMGASAFGVTALKYKPRMESAVNGLSIALNALNRIKSLIEICNKALEAKEGEAAGVIDADEQRKIMYEIMNIVTDPEIKYIMNKYKV